MFPILVNNFVVKYFLKNYIYFCAVSLFILCRIRRYESHKILVWESVPCVPPQIFRRRKLSVERTLEHSDTLEIFPIKWLLPSCQRRIMKTVGEALIAKMESQTLTLSSSSHSFNKTETKKERCWDNIQGNHTRRRIKKRKRIDLPNKICGLEQQVDE